MGAQVPAPLPSNNLTSVAAVEAPFGSSAAAYEQVSLQGTENTRKGYLSDLKSFQAFCSERNQNHLPADVATVADYIAHLADEGKKVSTISRHLSAIAKLHELANHPSPTEDKRVGNVLGGIKRTTTTRLKQAPAFTLEQLRTAIDALDLTTPQGLRDRALLLVGYSGAFRRTELVALDVESVQWKSETLVRLVMGRSKTNQHGAATQAADHKTLTYAPLALYCPVRALRDWMDCLNRPTGPLFVSVRWATKNSPARPSKHRLSDKSVNEVVRKHLGPAYSAHSLRVSFVTTAVEKGAHNKLIQNQTKHSTSSMIERYTRLDDVDRHNAVHLVNT